MLTEDDNLGIYDDLDDFQQAEDQKSKELLAWEVKHSNALTEIEDLKAQNKALGKKIKTMEVNLQNLLETAKSEIKRKEVLIGQLRKEKDDICFRRKRGREVEDPGDKEHGSKRTKSVSKVEAEVKKNPFKVDLKNDAKRVEKRRSRSKSPSLSHQKAAERRSKAQDHGSETRRKSRERRPSRSRSPRHSSRHEEHRSRGSSSRPNRRRSCSPSPRDQVSEPNTQKMTSLFGEDTTNCRESVKRPHHDKTKKMRNDIAAPVTPIELHTAEMAPKKAKTSRQVLSIECEDTSAVDGYFEGNTAFNPDNPASDIIVPVFGEAKEEHIPGLDMICDPPAQKIIELGKESQETSSESSKKNYHTNKTILTESESVTWDLIPVRNEEAKTVAANRDVILDDSSQAVEHLKGVPTATEFSKPAKESLIENSKYEHNDNVVHKSELNHSFNKLPKAHNSLHVEVNAQLPTQRDENINCSSGESISKPSDVGIRIIEDIRLPEVADIGHIAVIVDQLCDGLKGAGTKFASDEQTLPSGKDADLCDPHDSSKANCSLGELKESLAPTSSFMDAKPASVLYAQPDSTKVDHNDAENEVILEAAMNLLMGSDLPQPPQSAPTLSYPHLSLEEDAIEKALGQLHQTSPDETVVTSTSSRARKADNSPSAPPQSNKPEIPVFEKTPAKCEPQLSEVLQLELELPSPGQDITIDETIDECISNEELSKITKRCSLGHTDYQFEQRNDEIILRVKRRTRRRCQAPLDVRVPNPPNGGQIN